MYRFWSILISDVDNCFPCVVSEFSSERWNFESLFMTVSEYLLMCVKKHSPFVDEKICFWLCLLGACFWFIVCFCLSRKKGTDILASLQVLKWGYSCTKMLAGLQAHATKGFTKIWTVPTGEWGDTTDWSPHWEAQRADFTPSRGVREGMSLPSWLCQPFFLPRAPTRISPSMSWPSWPHRTSHHKEGGPTVQQWGSPWWRRFADPVGLEPIIDQQFHGAANLWHHTHDVLVTSISILTAPVGGETLPLWLLLEGQHFAQTPLNVSEHESWWGSYQCSFQRL